MSDWISTFADAAAVDISKRSASTPLFSLDNVIVRQIETVTVKEYRGLTKAAAKGAAGVTDETIQTTYYRKMGDVVHSISVVSGSKTERVASRANEADGWTVTETTAIFTVTPAASGSNSIPDGWSTSLVSSAGSDEIIVSVDKSSCFVFSFSGNTLSSKRVTTVKEKRHFDTKEHAEAAYTETSHDYTRYCCGVNVIVYATIPSGTERTVSVRKVSDAEGWTATATETEYSKIGSAWTVG